MLNLLVGQHDRYRAIQCHRVVQVILKYIQVEQSVWIGTSEIEKIIL